VNGFVDEVEIEVVSGNGGNGIVSFRREKYVPFGGPDGGDGGKGGDVCFTVKKNLKTLFSLKQKKIYKAQNGFPGMGRKKHGKNGKDVIIEVPPGTIIREIKTKEILKDLKEEGESWTFLKGGKGGKGNSNFATSTRQAPKFAKPGRPGIRRKIHVELNIIADIGFVGLPNAGKSTLLSVLTKANPKIANYPFTTKIPNLGVLHIYERDIILADIPGIIKGASNGAGLGIRFLKHIARTKLIVVLVDLSDPGFENAVDILLKELKSFLPELIEKKRLIIGTKLDILGTEENIIKLEKKYDKVIGISSVTGKGIEECKKTFAGMVK
jgi:GTPase